MRKMLTSSAWSGFSVASRALATVVVNKLFAVYYGPNGITLLAHFQNLIAILSTVPNGGINVGIIKHLATEKAGSVAYKKYFTAGLYLNLLALAGGIGIFFLSRDYYFGIFLEHTEPGTHWRWYLGFFFGSALLVLNLFLINVLLARGKLPLYVISLLIASILSVIGTVVGAGRMQVGAVLLLFLMGQGVAFFVSLLYAWRKELLPSMALKGSSRRVYLDLGKFVVMALSNVFFVRFVDFFVRDYVIGEFDLYQTGLWQSVAKISDNYTMVFTSLMGMLYYPRIAALLPQPDELRGFVRQAYLLVVPLVAGGLLFFYLFSDFLITLLYEPQFVQARFLLDYQLLGDFLKMASFLLSYIISVRADVKLYIATQGISALLYVGLLLLLLEPFGLEGVTMAHTLRYAAYLAFHLVYFRKLLF